MTQAAPIRLTDKNAAMEMNAGDCCSPPAIHVDVQEVAAETRLLSALADPTRLGIVSMLAQLDEPLCVCEIVTQFDLGQPTISHHLRLLREAGLVTWEKRGLWVYYSLNREALSGLTTYLSKLQRATSAPHAL